MIATYHLPTATPKSEAVNIAKPHGLTLISWEPRWKHVEAVFKAPNAEAIDGMSADLSYKPETVTA